MICDYCNKNIDFDDDKKVNNYIPELNCIYCDSCLNEYDKRKLQYQDQTFEEFINE